MMGMVGWLVETWILSLRKLFSKKEEIPYVGIKYYLDVNESVASPEKRVGLFKRR